MQIDEILNSLDWQKAWKEVATSRPQSRIEDDSNNKLVVVFSCDGDAWIQIEPETNTMKRCCRFRETSTGGGESKRVRQALMILALAIKADNKDRPQRR